jgi:hypothetical protein
MTSSKPITKIAQEACAANIEAAPFKMYVNSFSAKGSQVLANEGMTGFREGLEEGDKIAKNLAGKSQRPKSDSNTPPPGEDLTDVGEETSTDKNKVKL